jgi:hypothetical protein
MKHICLAMWGCVFLISSVGLCGELEFVEVESESKIPVLRSGLVFHNSTFDSNQDNDGTVNPHAVVAIQEEPNCEIPLAIAVDSTSPDASRPDVIRLDFTGTGQFADAPTVPLKPDRSNIWTISPTVVQVNHDGKSIPVRISGEYYKFPNNRIVHLKMDTAKKGTCRFGDRDVTVQIHDSTTDMSFHQAAGLTDSPDISHFRPGDWMQIQVGSDTIVAFYGQPIYLDDQWWSVTVDDRDETVTARPVDQPSGTGTLTIQNMDDYKVLLGDKQGGCWLLMNADSPLHIPAGEYRVFMYSGRVHSGGKPMQAIRYQQGDPDKNWLTVQADKTTALLLGRPLKAQVTAETRDGGRVEFSYAPIGPQGMRMQVLGASTISQPPTLEVYDANQKKIYNAKMRFG